MVVVLPQPGESLGVRMSSTNEVLDIDPQGRAAISGLRKHDRICSVDGHQLVSRVWREGKKVF